MKLSGSNGV